MVRFINNGNWKNIQDTQASYLKIILDPCLKPKVDQFD